MIQIVERINALEDHLQSVQTGSATHSQRYHMALRRAIIDADMEWKQLSQPMGPRSLPPGDFSLTREQLEAYAVDTDQEVPWDRLPSPSDSVTVAQVDTVLTDVDAFVCSIAEVQGTRCEHAAGLLPVVSCLQSRIRYERQTVQSSKLPQLSTIGTTLTDLLGTLRAVCLIPKSVPLAACKADAETFAAKAKASAAEGAWARGEGEIALLDSHEKSEMTHWGQALRAIVDQYPIYQELEKDSRTHDLAIDYAIQQTSSKLDRVRASVESSAQKVDIDLSTLQRHTVAMDTANKSQFFAERIRRLDDALTVNAATRQSLLEQQCALDDQLEQLAIERRALTQEKVSAVVEEENRRASATQYKIFLEERERRLTSVLEDSKRITSGIEGLRRMCNEVTSLAKKHFEVTYKAHLSASRDSLDEQYGNVFCGYFQSVSGAIRRRCALRQRLCEQLIGDEARFEVHSDVLDPCAKRYVVGMTDVKNQIQDIDSQVAELERQREMALRAFSESAEPRLKKTRGQSYRDPREEAIDKSLILREVALEFYDIETKERVRTKKRDPYV